MLWPESPGWVDLGVLPKNWRFWSCDVYDVAKQMKHRRGLWFIIGGLLESLPTMGPLDSGMGVVV